MVFPQIISGVETGAERAAHDWAIANEIPHGGWRVETNVVHSSATVVFTLTAKPRRHARLVVKLANHHRKPWLHIHNRTRLPAMFLESLVVYNHVSRLHVSGSTALEEPAISRFVLQILDQAAAFLRER
jgi:hypothetical protein